jgi:hypothetical protein
MSSAVPSAARKPVLASLRLFSWRHPEWWSVALCTLAWGMLLVHGVQQLQHGSHPAGTFAEELRRWLWMVAAMMLPFTLHSVRATAVGSLWARRQRAMAEFLVGYFAPWLVVGLAVAALHALAWAHTSIAAGLCFALAALWQQTSLYARGLAECHRNWPLAPAGWKADRDCLRFGAAIGVACVQTSWPWMLACALAGHGLVAMAGSMALAFVERRSFWPRPRRVLAGTLALACGYLWAGGLAPVLFVACSPTLQANPGEVTELAAETAGAFSLAGITHIELTLRVPTPSAAGPAGQRVFLNIERMTSGTLSPPYDVYLDVPIGEDPARHPELRAGLVSMYGLVPASRAAGADAAPGLSEKLEITELYARLAAARGNGPASLRVSFVPARPVDGATVRVGRVSLYLTRPAP